LPEHLAMLTVDRRSENRKQAEIREDSHLPMSEDAEQTVQSVPPGANLGHLWTPWRAAYVGVAQPAGCFLCDFAGADPEDDRANLVLYRESDVFLLLNRFPYSPGHLLIAPRAHLGDLSSLEPELRDHLFALVQRASRVLTEAYRTGGMNIGMNLGRAAGAGVPDHVHAHVVPRWSGDSNFMTVVGETRVLPESLDQSWGKLRPHFH
jgi:ATP adenylyltransferase